LISGTEAKAFVSWLCAAPVTEKSVGTVTYTPLCNEKGGVEADLTVTKMGEERYYFAAGGGTQTKDLHHIHTSLQKWRALRCEGEGESEGEEAVAAGVTVSNVSDEYAILSVQGPYAKQLLAGVITSDHAHAMSNEDFPFSTGVDNMQIAGHNLLLCLRLTFVGEQGWELHIPAESAVAVYEALHEYGQTLTTTHSGADANRGNASDGSELNSEYTIMSDYSITADLQFVKHIQHYHKDYEQEMIMLEEMKHAAHLEPVLVRDAGYKAIDTLSAEKNYRHWHADLANYDTPLEAAIGFTVIPRLKNTDSSDTFQGRAALEAQRASGVRRKLVCFGVGGGHSAHTASDDAVPIHGGETIWRADQPDKPVGYIRSTAYSHTLGTSLAYGYVECPDDVEKVTNKWLKSAEYELEVCGVRHNAELHIKAPFDPKNARIKGEYEWLLEKEVDQPDQGTQTQTKTKTQLPAQSDVSAMQQVSVNSAYQQHALAYGVVVPCRYAASSHMHTKSGPRVDGRGGSLSGRGAGGDSDNSNKTDAR